MLQITLMFIGLMLFSGIICLIIRPSKKLLTAKTFVSPELVIGMIAIFVSNLVFNANPNVQTNFLLHASGGFASGLALVHIVRVLGTKLNPLQELLALFCHSFYVRLH